MDHLTLALSKDVLWTLLVLLLLIALNLLVAVAEAAARGEFKWAKLPDFLRAHVLGLWVPVLALGAAALFVPGFKAAFYPAAAAVAAKFIASLKSKVESWGAPAAPGAGS